MYEAPTFTSDKCPQTYSNRCVVLQSTVTIVHSTLHHHLLSTSSITRVIHVSVRKISRLFTRTLNHTLKPPHKYIQYRVIFMSKNEMFGLCAVEVDDFVNKNLIKTKNNAHKLTTTTSRLKFTRGRKYSRASKRIKM